MDILEAKRSKKELEQKILSLIKEFENNTKTYVDSIEIESIKMYNVSCELGNHHTHNSPVNVIINVLL